MSADGVAYLAPTKALVSQIARQLRRDFEPLGISVEQVSPALEVDTIEADLLHLHDLDQAFRSSSPHRKSSMLCYGRVGRQRSAVH